MLIVGAVAASLISQASRAQRAGTREFESNAPSSREENLFRKWLAFSRSVADYEVRIVLVLCYWIFVAPLAIAHRLSASEDQRDATTAWLNRQTEASMESARRPF